MLPVFATSTAASTAVVDTSVVGNNVVGTTVAASTVVGATVAASTVVSSTVVGGATVPVGCSSCGLGGHKKRTHHACLNYVPRVRSNKRLKEQSTAAEEVVHQQPTSREVIHQQPTISASSYTGVAILVPI